MHTAACDVGKTTNGSHCIDCDAGYFKDFIGDMACLMCNETKPFTTSETPGGVDNATCRKCIHGSAGVAPEMYIGECTKKCTHWELAVIASYKCGSRICVREGPSEILPTLHSGVTAVAKIWASKLGVRGWAQATPPLDPHLGYDKLYLCYIIVNNSIPLVVD